MPRNPRGIASNPHRPYTTAPQGTHASPSGRQPNSMPDSAPAPSAGFPDPTPGQPPSRCGAMTGKKKSAQASVEAMYRVFTVPEAPESTLIRIDQDNSRNLGGVLQQHIVAIERDQTEVEKDFSDYVIPGKPEFVPEQTQFVHDKLVAN